MRLFVAEEMTALRETKAENCSGVGREERQRFLYSTFFCPEPKKKGLIPCCRVIHQYAARRRAVVDPHVETGAAVAEWPPTGGGPQSPEGLVAYSGSSARPVQVRSGHGDGQRHLPWGGLRPCAPPLPPAQGLP